MLFRSVDACVAKFTEKDPEVTGRIGLRVVYRNTGEPWRVEVTERLPGARHLLACLDRVARTWRLPPMERDYAKLDVTVAVYPGARFDLRPPPPQEEDEPPPPPLGTFTFQPGGFINAGWSGRGAAGRRVEGNGTAPPPSEMEPAGEAPEDPGTGRPAEGAGAGPELPGEAAEDDGLGRAPEDPGIGREG